MPIFLKDWFPFTDYDFYGYLSSGLVLLCALDYWYSGGQLLQRDQWTVLQGAVVVAVAYVAGQFVSMPASIIFETFIARSVLRAPIAVLLSSNQGFIERNIGRFCIGRYYAPLPIATRNKVFAKAEIATGLSRAQLSTNPEEVFVPAYEGIRQFDSVSRRLDDFRNQYGFNRNMAMTGFFIASLMFDRLHRIGDQNAFFWMVLALLLSIGMLVRFLKFYSCYAAEILRAYAHQESPPK